MILPTTYGVALLLIIVSMFCWGSWANTFKLTGRWRFELFYFDYSFGVVLAAAIAVFTFGSLGNDMNVADNLSVASKTRMLYGFAGGVVFNLANMLLVAAISIAGLAVAFPVGIGLALVIGVIWNYRLNPQGNPTLLFAGCGLVAVAIVLDALAYRGLDKARTQEKIAASLDKTGKRDAKGAKVGIKGIVLSLVSGVLMGSFYPLVELGKAGEPGLRLEPYSIGIIFAAGVFVSTLVFNLYFMNLPVQGEPVSFFEYFKGTAKQHLLGVVGGLIWCIGTLSNFAASSTPPEIQVGPAISYALGQGATMVSALWGLLVWKEFAGANFQVKVLLTVMMILFLTGLGLISIAPLYPR